MQIEEIIVTIAIVLITGLALFYIIKSKKSGKKCIGCPDSGSCCHKKTNQSSDSCCCCSHCKND